MKSKIKLIASFFAIVICITMLFGTTYAYFIDSVINTNNIIRSGNFNTNSNVTESIND